MYCTILSLLWAQDGYITGIIVSEDQAPIHGANIFSETLDIGTISQVDGSFTLNKISENKFSLTISMIGFKEVKNTIIMDGLSYDLGTVIMLKDTIKLNQIDVEAHHELQPHNFASNIDFSGKEYHENLKSTLALTLEQQTGLSIQSMGQATAKPVLRGYSGDRFLLTENGVTIGDLSNTSIDHAISIDMASFNNVRIIRGPESLLFGSNTIGGVIDVSRQSNLDLRFKKISFLSFQPVSFTGRDEEITDERRHAQRYTLSHLAHDVKNQTGIGEPTRDWFPISFMGTFTDWADLVHGPQEDWGQLNCGCHPNCGVGMAVMIDKETKEAVPFTAFVKGERLAKDIATVNDAARGRFSSVVGMALALMRNYDPFKSPTHFKLSDLMKKFDKTFGATGHDYGSVTGSRTHDDIAKRREDRWNFLFVAGMWFQDLFNYDFRRTERCIIPYATQEGEISFCAYNTGIGWRNIIEKMHMTATLTKWYEEHGRHEIFAGGKEVGLGTTEHSLVLDEAAVAAGVQTDLDQQGIAKNARQEKFAARAALQNGQESGPDQNADEKDARYHEQMAQLYRQKVLKEEAPETVQIQGLKSNN